MEGYKDGKSRKRTSSYWINWRKREETGDWKRKY